MSDRRSIGYAIATELQKEGAELLLTSFGRMMTITEMTARKLNPVPDILEMDVQKPSDIKPRSKRFQNVGAGWTESCIRLRSRLRMPSAEISSTRHGKASPRLCR